MPRTEKSYNCLVVLGPTASGKTRLAAQLAFHLGGEVISADSRQVYRGLDIGTGKDLEAYEVNGFTVPYHLIGIADPKTQFYLHDFAAALRKAFGEIVFRNKLPVICGGTGLYLDALRKDFHYTAVPEDHRLRHELEKLDKPALRERLAALSTELSQSVDKNSKKRLVRGIEIGEYLRANSIASPAVLPYRPYYIGIKTEAAERQRLIMKRLDERLESGLIGEVRAQLEQGVTHERLGWLGLEYKFISLFLRGELSFDDMRAKLGIAIRQFAKRQMTWFRKMEKEGVVIRWIGVNYDLPALLEELKCHFGDK